MSARRQARGARRTLPASKGGVPASLLLRACIEVWAEDPAAPDAWLSARRRHSRARYAFLEPLDLSVAESCELIPATGAPWSIEYVGDAKARERFRDVGALLDDLPHLAAEADELATLSATFERAPARAGR